MDKSLLAVRDINHKYIVVERSKTMNSQTSLVAKKYRLQQWAMQISECQNRPKEMTVDEWCEQHSITKANYYYRLKRVRQAYLDSETPSLTEFVEMPTSVKVENICEKASVSAVLNIDYGISIELLDSASTSFIKNLFGALNHAQ